MEKVNIDALEGLRQLRVFIHTLLEDLNRLNPELKTAREVQYYLIIDGKIHYKGRIEQ